jgi:hypothetical protein
MSFERIWTALLGGALLAVALTLCLAAGASLLVPGHIFGREALTYVWLIAWGLATMLCLLPMRVLGQWLVALGSSALALLGMAAITAGEPGAGAPMAAIVAAALAIAAIALALRGRRRSRL